MATSGSLGASLGSATGGVPQNDRAFASLSMATQSAEYTTCAKTSPLKKPLPQVASRSANGLLAAISPADLPAVFSFCTRKLNATAPKKQQRLGSGASQAVCFEQEMVAGVRFELTTFGL